eukprot:CAMPEP_0178419288 /NCGR_PEP_ID=MMETSP0689_2-20121128/25532_1 /TAXON_ID=160604 /ORGANISM="Amphidinium massartii, Strain CS-259" /LENGTH=375 /DNA_ID=CAMNT_0020040719 /DNA_START=62 /DNA_END=1186 /DNA_ORIENTATION=+
MASFQASQLPSPWHKVLWQTAALAATAAAAYARGQQGTRARMAEPEAQSRHQRPGEGRREKSAKKESPEFEWKEVSADWVENVEEEEAITAEAANLGSPWWETCLEDQVAKWIDQYFLLSSETMLKGHPSWVVKKSGWPPGWKWYRVGGRTVFWNPKTKKMQNSPPEIVEHEVPEPLEAPVTLLEVGNCYSGFARFGDTIHALGINRDLAIGAEGVVQADFLEVPVVEATSSSQDESMFQLDHPGVSISDDGESLALIAGTFRAVVMTCNTLSDLDSPADRLVMIQKARQCLVEDRGLLFVIENHNNFRENRFCHTDLTVEWTKAIEAVGFRHKLFEDRIAERRRRKRITQWIFETAPHPSASKVQAPLAQQGSP